MTQVILHRSEEYIVEDLQYFFSSERDKNNQIKPDKSIHSLTPTSYSLNSDNSEQKTSNIFFPQLPNQWERIYIGISVSLFANHWGASFLTELLKQVKPGGVIILPVYPEAQAAEKGFWSRSFLENVFLSRSRWQGISNVNAENDGVMSLRIGKKFPEPVPSSIEWFYQERSNLLLNSSLKNDCHKSNADCIQEIFNSLCKLIWLEYHTSAIVEKIIQDYSGKKKSLSVISIEHDYGLLMHDLMLSPQLDIQYAVFCQMGVVETLVMESISSYFAPITDVYLVSYEERFTTSMDVIILRDLIKGSGIQAYEVLVEEAWSHLNIDGLLIIFEDFTNDKNLLDKVDLLLSKLGNVTYYSSIVASEIEPDLEISQYSLAIEEKLRREAKNKDRVFRVLRKANSGFLHVK